MVTAVARLAIVAAQERTVALGANPPLVLARLAHRTELVAVQTVMFAQGQHSATAVTLLGRVAVIAHTAVLAARPRSELATPSPLMERVPVLTVISVRAQRLVIAVALLTTVEVPVYTAEQDVKLLSVHVPRSPFKIRQKNRNYCIMP